MTSYVELLIHIGHPRRYFAATKARTSPLIVEAESAYRDPDKAAAKGISYCRDPMEGESHAKLQFEGFSS
jgi:hypothetical protein